MRPLVVVSLFLKAAVLVWSSFMVKTLKYFFISATGAFVGVYFVLGQYNNNEFEFSIALLMFPFGIAYGELLWNISKKNPST